MLYSTLIPLALATTLPIAGLSAVESSDASAPSTAADASCCAAMFAEDMDWSGVLDEESFAALHELKEGEEPDLLGEDVEVGGMDCYLTKPSDGIEPLGAVIVIHEWWGLNAHVKHWADRLASDGYVALAIDLYGGVVATDRDEAMAAMKGVDTSEAVEKMVAAHAWLTDSEGPVNAERTACIGWCFGGGMSLQLAIAEPDLDAAVIYYGRLVDDVETLGNIEASVLGIFGTEDRGIPPKVVDAFESNMREAGRDIEIRSYDANHAFANPSSARYAAEPAAEAWRETRAFLCAELWPDPNDERFSAGRELMATVPGAWVESEGSTMRIASFTVGSATDVSVIPLGGDGGGLAPNLARWSTQLGEDAMDDEEIAALPRIPVLGRLGVVYREDGSIERPKPIENAAILALFVELEGEVLSVKMTGPKDEVDAAADEFIAYCRSLR